MAARKLWKGEEAIPKNREPLKKKEWPPRPTLKKKVEWPSRPILKKNEWPQKEYPPRPPFKKKEWPRKEEPSTIVNIKQPIAGRRKGEPVPPPPHTPLKPAPRRSSTLR